MKILIDIGNTRTKASWLCPKTGQREAAIVAVPHQQPNATASLRAQLPSSFKHVIGVSVADTATTQAIEQQLAAAQAVPPVFTWVQPSASALGVLNNYQPHHQLGADRWVAMLGLAWHIRQQTRRPCSALLANFGTATTIDTLLIDYSVAPGKQPGGLADTCTFSGGLILPGANLMRLSLANGTARLPCAEGITVLHPRNTHEAIASGIAAAQAGALLRQWLGLQHQTGHPPAVYVTGGAWPAVQATIESSLLELYSACNKPYQPPCWLASPILDGLTCLASQSSQPFTTLPHTLKTRRPM